jgi:hypothetical protein
MLLDDKEIENRLVPKMVKRYAIARRTHKAKVIKWNKEAPIRARKRLIEKYKDSLRSKFIKKFGFADESFIDTLVEGKDYEQFNVFTEDPNCNSCGKGEGTDDQRRDNTEVTG